MATETPTFKLVLVGDGGTGKVNGPPHYTSFPYPSDSLLSYQHEPRGAPRPSLPQKGRLNF